MHTWIFGVVLATVALSSVDASPDAGSAPKPLSDGAFAKLTAIPESPKPHYKADFEKHPGPFWSNGTTSATPTGKRRFLGRLGNNTTTLMLTKLPKHAFVRVRLDLLIIQSWDGDRSDWGPDIWQMLVAGGPTLVRTSFDFAGHRKQAYPDNLPLIAHTGTAGAAETGKLGYMWEGNQADAVYRIDVVFPHRQDYLDLQCEAVGLEGVDSESWGLDNVRVDLLQQKDIPALTRPQCAALIRELDSEDAARAQRAQRRLVVGGEEAARALEARTSAPPEVREQVNALTPQLDSDDYEEREAATQALIALGAPVIGPMRELRSRSKSAEVRERAAEVIEAVQKLKVHDAGTERATFALAIIRDSRPVEGDEKASPQKPDTEGAKPNAPADQNG
jgi:hypothetical protein